MMLFQHLSRSAVLVGCVLAGCVLTGCKAKVAVEEPNKPASHQLNLPERPLDARSGSEVVEAITGLGLVEREEILVSEILGGNVPSWLRELSAVKLEAIVSETRQTATIWVTPDYLAVGSGEDYFLAPLSPQSAQRIADRVGASVPTPRIVDAIWDQAEIKMRPSPIDPSPEMTTVPMFSRHNSMLLLQRDSLGTPSGALVAGHKKDVVLTVELADRPSKVAIYGWHRLNGHPVQPLYLGHTDRWVDYSHGIRLVDNAIEIGTEKYNLIDVLQSRTLAVIFSEEGPMDIPSYLLQ